MAGKSPAYLAVLASTIMLSAASTRRPAFLLRNVYCFVPHKPAIARKLPKSFTFFQSPHPVNLSKSLHDYTRSEISSLAEACSASGPFESSQKRKPGDNIETTSTPTPRVSRIDPLPLLPTLVPTPPAAPTLKSLSYDVWHSAIGWATESLPGGVNLEELVASDAEYQRSELFDMFMRPIDRRRATVAFGRVKPGWWCHKSNLCAYDETPPLGLPGVAQAITATP
ncbi:hypothetical protein FRC08_015778 [Ceratobasidium sp. 394]|nr:hypothetical protein FRC08_015778 [Ceratobasidium sp. 394]KAG9098572.1 hypothetical protein FS749_003515 [Ceratobasidium sp. UAMH 11750]